MTFVGRLTHGLVLQGSNLDLKVKSYAVSWKIYCRVRSVLFQSQFLNDLNTVYTLAVFINLPLDASERKTRADVVYPDAV